MCSGNHSDSVPQPAGSSRIMGRLFEILFGCTHRRLSRPVTPTRQSGNPDRQTYVVCLDCGKRLAYDLQAMRVGKVLDR